MGLETNRKKALPIFQQKNEISADCGSLSLTPSRDNQGKGLYSKWVNVLVKGLLRTGTYFALGLRYSAKKPSTRAFIFLKREFMV
jgi:hypothetical protein